ncbi:WD40 repeat-like protein [Trichoderma velutinum]
MDLAATHSRKITGNHFGDNTTINQVDIHYHSPNHKTQEDDTKCLAGIRVTDPRDDKTRIEATKGGLFKDSYRWILEHSDFRQWRDDERSHLLWIKGDPGKGKTMLLCGIVDELSSGTRLKDQKASTLLSYFFCQAADERINSATAVLRGLIYLIVEQQPLLVSHIQKKYKHGGQATFKDANAWTALSEIFLNILEDTGLERTYVVIDALDECLTDLPKLLDFINTKSTLCSRVKWIVSSRNWPDIEERLDSATQQTRLCLELNEKSISAAVDAYIKHQVAWLARRKKYNAITKNAVHHHLSSNSNNTFLWVALVCQNLERILLQSPLRTLNKFPPGLDSLYKRMMEQIHDLENGDAKFCYQILATVLLLYRPVTLAELGSLIVLPEDNSADAELIYKAIGLCGSFLTVRDSRIYVIHQSAKDYLSDKAVSTIFPSSSADVHGVIFARSLQAMSATLRRNIYNLYSPGTSINDIKAPDPDPLAAVRYSCVYWVDHFCYVYNSVSQSQDQVDHKYQTVSLFLRKYFLYWLEALGLMGHIEDGVLLITRLENLLRGKSPDRQSSDCQLLELAQDSRRFIRQNSLLIANSPLQIYTSALTFSPLNSSIRKIFEEEELQWLKVKPTVEYNWSPYLQTLKGHSESVLSVAFSADGRYLASGSWDKTIKIWDATTGKERQTLKGHSDTVRSVAFSVDGRYLASGSDNRTVKIWDVTIGKQRQTLKGHSDWVASVAFSADGRYIASGSWDKTIRIWDTTTGKEQQTLKGHSNTVYSIAFSADSRYLASGSWDKTIKIWDAITGKERQTLKGHSNAVYSVAFSADSCYVASGSRDRTIKIWDMTTGKEHQILQGHSDIVNSVTFSADSFYLISGSDDETIKIWDVTTGKTQQTLKGHSGAVFSVAFSADSRYLASGSRDNTITIWDATTSKEQQTFRGNSGWVISVAFSADGRYLASGSYDSTIKIWDATTGKERQTLKGHSSIVSSVAFSTDGRYLASGSNDNTIKIWDAATGKERQTLKGHSSIVSSVAFSMDGRYLASGSGPNYVSFGLDDSIIQIWDVMTGKERQTLTGHSNWVRSVAFSADGSYLASGSEDKTIRIWDTTKGKELQTLKVDTAIYTISFDDTASYLSTDIGPIKLGVEHQTKTRSAWLAQVLSPDSYQAQDQDQRRPIATEAEKATLLGYGLSTDGCWITWNEHNILWLPPEYQSSTSAVWRYAPPSTSPQVPLTDVAIALGTGSGRVVVFRMSGSGPFPCYNL